MGDQRIDKWTRWIDGTIKRNVLTMHLHREAWRTVANLLDENGQLPASYWWEFMRDTYVVTQAVAVRRQADTSGGAASLARLIVEVRDNPSRVTRKLWTDLWDECDPRMLQRAERGWAEHYAGSVGGHLDPAIPTADLDALKEAAVKVTEYVNKHVAHADSSAVSASVALTLEDVHVAIETIGELFKKYYSLLTASSYIDLVPIIQHDWQAVFREPWIRPGSPQRETRVR